MEFLDCIRRRRSARSFLPVAVPAETVLYCLDAARLAPSSLNSQPWKFIVVDDPQLKSRVAGCICNPLLQSNMQARQAPVLILVVNALPDNASPLLRTAVKKFGMSQYDIGFAVQSLCLAATNAGLASCVMDTIRKKARLRELLNIPPDKEICLAVALGYPTGEEPPPQERKPLEEICSWNSFLREE